MLAVAVIALAIAAVTLGEKLTPQSQTASIATPFNPFTGIKINGKAAIVIDISTGKTLYEKNSNIPLPLASLTKTALALVVAEALPLDSGP